MTACSAHSLTSELFGFFTLFIVKYEAFQVLLFDLILKLRRACMDGQCSAGRNR